MTDFLRNGIKEAFVSARLSKERVGKGSLLTYLFDICWSFILYGARPRDYVMFEFYYQNHRRRNQCFTTFRFFKLTKKLDKLNKNAINSNKEVELKLYAPFIKRSWLCVDSGTTKDSILAFISNNSKVIVKPNGGTYGKGIFMINGESDENLKILLDRQKTEKFILEEVVENIEEIAKFNRSSLNTFRVFTFIKSNGDYDLLAVILRVGRPGSVVDNWAAGGIIYNFDLQTGICDQPGRDKNMNKYIFHPGTEYQMIGYKLPMFSELKKYVSELVKVVPEARYVGWDIALTPKGFDLIELNCPGGNDILQASGKYFYDYIKANW